MRYTVLSWSCLLSFLCNPYIPILIYHLLVSISYSTPRGKQLVFNAGDDRQCHTINNVDDNDCEQPPENLFTDLCYVSGQQVVTINPVRTTVFIDNDNEPEYGKITDCGYQVFTLRATYGLYAYKFEHAPPKQFLFPCCV